MQTCGWTSLPISLRTALTQYWERNYAKAGTHGWNTPGQLSGLILWISALIQLTVSTWCAALEGEENKIRNPAIFWSTRKLMPIHEKWIFRLRRVNVCALGEHSPCKLKRTFAYLFTQVSKHIKLGFKWVKVPHYIHSSSWALLVSSNCTICVCTYARHFQTNFPQLSILQVFWDYSVAWAEGREGVWFYHHRDAWRVLLSFSISSVTSVTQVIHTSIAPMHLTCHSSPV